MELLVGPLLPRVADDAQVLEPFAVLERQQRGEQQPCREVARCAQHHQRQLVVRLDHSGQGRSDRRAASHSGQWTPAGMMIWQYEACEICHPSRR